MKFVHDVYKQVAKQPLLLQLTTENKHKCSGLLYLDDDRHLRFSYLQNQDNILFGETFHGSFHGGYIRTQLHGSHSSAFDEQMAKLPGQKQMDYRYLLYSTEEQSVCAKSYKKMVLVFPIFFDNFGNVDKKGSLQLGEAKFKNCKITIRATESESIQRFPYVHRKEVTMLWIEFEYEKSKDVEELIRCKNILTAYLAPFLRGSIEPNEILFGIPNTKKRGPKYSYARFISNKDEILKQDDVSIKFVDDPISFESQGEYFLKYVGPFFDNFENILQAASLIELYWEYKEKKVYFDTLVSVLFTAIEATYESIKPPSKRQPKRESAYESLLASLAEDTPHDLKRFLVRAKEHYASPNSFEGKLEHIAKQLDYKLPKGLAKNANKLRNALMHGDSLEWERYIRTRYDRLSGEGEDKIDTNELAYITARVLIENHASQQR